MLRSSCTSALLESEQRKSVSPEDHRGPSLDKQIIITEAKLLVVPLFALEGAHHLLCESPDPQSLPCLLASSSTNSPAELPPGNSQCVTLTEQDFLSPGLTAAA